MDDMGKVHAYRMPHYSDEIKIDIEKFIKKNEIPFLFLLKAKDFVETLRDPIRIEDIIFRYSSDRLVFDPKCTNFENVNVLGSYLSHLCNDELTIFKKNICKIDEFVFGNQNPRTVSPYGGQSLVDFGDVIPKNIESIHDTMCPIRFV